MNYAFYRRALFTDPDASSTALSIVNRYRLFLGQRNRVRAVQPVMHGSLGSTLFHQRSAMGYTLGALASLCGVSREVMKKVELGWLIPEGEEGADFLAAISVFCGFSVDQYYDLLSMAERELFPAYAPVSALTRAYRA